MKRLRKQYPEQEIPMVVTGEYGEEKKRPHWHAIIFNWWPKDAKYLRKNERGDTLYQSPELDKIWGLNDPEKKPNEIGQVSYHSAGYVMRYAAKKLVHGHDKNHPYQPISRKSSKYAIGKTFLQEYWKDIFSKGHCILQKEDGQIIKTPIPRYYEKWLLKEKPEIWRAYVTGKKAAIQDTAKAKADTEQHAQNLANLNRDPYKKAHQITRKQTQRIIIEERFKRLQQYLKGDI